MSKLETGRPKTGGRQKGTPNKTTAALKDAIILAAERVGKDGKGQDGLTGYLEHVASTDVKAFASLLGKVLPMQVTGEDGGAVVVEIHRFAHQSA
jgi:hypothetical protein